MNKKLFFILVAFVLLLALAIYGWQKQQAFEYVKSSRALIEDLSTKVNDIAKIGIVSKDTSLSLVKQGGQWVLREQDNYPADVTKIRSLLLKLARSNLLEEKTSMGELYAKLGLDETNRVNISAYLDKDKTQSLFSLAVGNTSGTIGTYVLLEDDVQSWLASEQIFVDTEVSYWLQDELFNILPKEIKELGIQHNVEQQSLTLMANDYGTAFVLNDLPESKETDLTRVNSITTAFRKLRIKEVHHESTKEFSDGVTSRVVTSDGMSVTAMVFQEQNQYWAKFVIEGNIENVEIPSDNTTDTAEDVLARTQERIDRIKPKLDSRIFLIYEPVGQALSYKRDDIVKTKQEAQ